MFHVVIINKFVLALFIKKDHMFVSYIGLHEINEWKLVLIFLKKKILS